ncbi:MAG TPA: porin family protein [Flavisolibacter sp.]|nr:porin family protein [Flavisolibacter sp.]
MKKISLFALALTTSLAMYAQNENVAPMAIKPRFGIKAGANLAKLRPQNYPNGTELETNLHTSVHAGFLANIPFGTGGFALQPEVLYSGQGSKMSQMTTVGTVTTETKYEQDLSYLTVPIMLQWKSRGGFFVETGPQVGFLLNAQAEGPGSTNTDNEDAFENFDFSWGAGIGYLSRIGLGIGARYNHGISNILTNEVNTGGGEPELKNSVINIGLFWHFGAGK